MSFGPKWVLSLGAGKDQIPILKAIHSLGARSLAVDSDPEAPGKDIADAFFNVSNRDVNAILKAASHAEISGVVAAGSEVPDVLELVRYRLKCPGNSVALGLLMRDKLAYKKVLKAAGVPHTEAHVVYEGAAKATFDELGYHVVVKPQRGSGSRGVTYVSNPMELQLAVQEAEDVGSQAIMERYQPGPQLSTETLFWDGRFVTVAYIDRFYVQKSDFHTFHELGGSAPSEWTSEILLVDLLVSNAARALGIRRGSLKCDIVLTEKGPMIIECTSRLSGGPLASIVKRHSGVDHLRQAVRIACGVEPDWAALAQHEANPICVDMDGKDMSWKESRQFIAQELGECLS